MGPGDAGEEPGAEDASHEAESAGAEAADGEVFEEEVGADHEETKASPEQGAAPGAEVAHASEPEKVAEQEAAGQEEKADDGDGGARGHGAGVCTGGSGLSAAEKGGRGPERGGGREGIFAVARRVGGPLSKRCLLFPSRL